MERSTARRLLAAVVALILLALGVPTAGAYHETTTTTTTSTTEATSSTSEATSSSTTGGSSSSSSTPETITEASVEDEDEETTTETYDRQEATAPETMTAGGEAPVSTTFTAKEGETAIPAGSEVSVLVTDTDHNPVFQATAVTRADGSISVQVTVPANTKPGVYVVAIILPAADGRRAKVAVTTITVNAPTTTSSSSGSQTQSAGASADPATAAKVNASLTPGIRALITGIIDQITAAGEEELWHAVVDDGGDLSLDGATLLLNGRPVVPEDSNSSRALFAAFGVGAVGAGLIALRRRNPAGALR